MRSSNSSNRPPANAAGDRIAALQAQVLKLQRELDQANRKIVELESRPPASAEGRKFREIKNRFARRYHPDSLRSTGIEAMVRTEIFKEFWADFVIGNPIQREYPPPSYPRFSPWGATATAIVR
jgi:hypothetical protein